MHRYYLRQTALRIQKSSNGNTPYREQALRYVHLLFLTITNFSSSRAVMLSQVFIQIVGRFGYCSFKTAMFFLDLVFFLILLNEIIIESLQHLIYFVHFLHLSYLLYTFSKLMGRIFQKA